ncbi:unnamed protein product [Protopolystoma xenopodis]|uniref:Uncharacterized protein n=1 Tax=Protopolystoma xenopodis TaxID=117903 RepID=A0A3S5FG91_9PLAT|nr:unnamed protein product [Protopolystoma xenopodis]
MGANKNDAINFSGDQSRLCELELGDLVRSQGMRTAVGNGRRVSGTAQLKVGVKGSHGLSLERKVVWEVGPSLRR